MGEPTRGELDRKLGRMAVQLGAARERIEALERFRVNVGDAMAELAREDHTRPAVRKALTRIRELLHETTPPVTGESG